MFGIDSPEGYAEAAEGIRIKTVVRGESVLMTKFAMSAGAKLPSHAHPHEQIGYLLSGRIVLRIGESAREMGPGDSWCVPSGVAHRADVIEESVALEVFSPAREDYLKYLNEADIAE